MEWKERLGYVPVCLMNPTHQTVRRDIDYLRPGKYLPMDLIATVGDMNWIT